MNDPLSMWVIYDHPTDYPDSFIARRWVEGDRQVVIVDRNMRTMRKDYHATKDIIVTQTLEELRKTFKVMGLVCLNRTEDDDPKIVEVWL